MADPTDIFIAERLRMARARRKVTLRVQARLDRAITEARHRMLKAQRNVVDIARGSQDTLYALDRRDEAVDTFAALVALRAWREELLRLRMREIMRSEHGSVIEARMSELNAEAERLLGEDA